MIKGATDFTDRQELFRKTQIFNRRIQIKEALLMGSASYILYIRCKPYFLAGAGAASSSLIVRPSVR
jgi:hypothetical protein